jgi:hypothetical protein
LVLGFADYQHFADIVVSAPGNWKQHPLTGVNAAQYINAPISSATSIAFKRNAKLQIEADGAIVEEIITGKDWLVNIKGEYLEP